MQFDLSGVSVMLAMPIHYDVPWQTMVSALETQALCASQGINLQVAPIVGGDTVVTARSKAAHHFLKSTCSHLFWIDADITWFAQDFVRFVGLGTVMECVTALYPIKQDPIGFFINISKDAETGGMETNEWGCLPIQGSGLGFTIVQRKVIGLLAAKAPKLRFPDLDEPVACIFQVAATEDGAWQGEDINFFAQVKQLGYRVNLDPSIELGHIGPKVFKGRILDYLQQSSLKESAR